MTAATPEWHDLIKNKMISEMVSDDQRNDQ